MRGSPQQLAEWDSYRRNALFDPDAAERGRLLAAHQIATDPESRKRVEDAFGVENVKRMYPEAYRHVGRLSGIVRFLDRIRAAIPW